MTTETISVSYQPALLEALNSGTLSAVDFVEQSFTSQPAQFARFTELLLTNHTDDGGSPQILGFKIINVEYNAETLRGKVIFSYRVGYTYACSGLYPENDRRETCSFTIHDGAGTINIDFLRIDSTSIIDEF